MAKPTAKVDNIPKAANAIPNIPNNEWATKAVKARNIIGIMVLR